MRQLLETMYKFAGTSVGQKPGDQVRGTEKAKKNGKKHPFAGRLVGGGAEEQQESILKDLSKGPRTKTIEEELAEAFAQFNEDDLGVEPKRPARQGARHHRGHEPHPQYKTIKADESSMSEKDIELQDYRSMSHKEFQTAYGMTKTEWINKNKSLVITNPSIKKGLGLDEAGNPAQQAAIAIAIKKAGKKPKNEGAAYKTANPHPASKDPIVAKVVKQMRPGLKDLDMNNEAFLYFAYEIGKMRAREMWEDYGPAIKYFYQSGIGVNEGWESGPEEYEEPYDDADDAYDRQRQAKIDTEAEKEWAKLPKVSTYQCTGRGPNMESNYEFGPEFDTQEKALKYREEIMKDPKTPHPEHIGIRTLTRIKEPTDESRGHTIIANKLKDVERAKKFASGELKVPTPQERQAQLKQLEKQPKTAEDLQPMANPQAGQNPTANPVNQQAVNQALNTIKTSTGSMASPQDIEKGLTDLAQGTANPLQVKKMKDVVTPLAVAATSGDPMAAQDIKSLAVRSKQIQQKQKAQQQKT